MDILKELDSSKMNLKEIKAISIIGLGYVGLPLAFEFSKKYNVVGYDINSKRVNELNKGIDSTNEVDKNILDDFGKKSNIYNIKFTTNKKDIAKSNVYILTVPTPIDNVKNPNLEPLKQASKIVSQFLKKNDVVIYESTVYPGCTEEVCVPILEEYSSLSYNKDFFCGYSPERINPGDKVNSLTKIIKVTSGSNQKISNFVDSLYSSIIVAGTHKASSIKVAEASKVIENAQRDLNISFVNELAIIFEKIGIDTNEVIDAAATKWNFLNFRPGLVGGHCISVDPYYLAFKAKSLGYYPDVILSGRKVNDYMPEFIASKLVKIMIKKDIKIKNSKVLILGITFKENCPDIRNTKIFDIYKELKIYNIDVEIYDPIALNEDVQKEFSINLINTLDNKTYDGIILAVSHLEFKQIDIKKLKKNNSVLIDTKGFFQTSLTDYRL